MKKPDWREWTDKRETCKRWFNGYLRKRILRKDRIGKELYLRKSEHNLNFANWVKEKHIPEIFGAERFYDWVISAYYYAVYHGALALISEKGFSSKSHNATLCAVIWFYYHQKRSLHKKDIELIGESIEKEDIETVAKTKSLRERASYDASAKFELNLVENARLNTVNFINKVRSILS
jgi:uncharacterized protein (UPF0332 family)